MTMDAHAVVEWIETLVHRLTQEYEIEIEKQEDTNGGTRTIIRLNGRAS